MPAMIATENFEQIEIQSLAELRAWLLEHHRQAASVWLVTYKKSVPSRYVSRWEVLDELICFGWIDGIRRKLDEHRTMQLIVPRRAEHWAQTYKDRAARLIEEGRMHAAGLESIESAQRGGWWNFMDDVDQRIVPPDLVAELAKWPGASEFFAAISPSSQRFVLRWIKLAKTERTRTNRIQKIAALAAKGEKLPGS